MSIFTSYGYRCAGVLAEQSIFFFSNHLSSQGTFPAFNSNFNLNGRIRRLDVLRSDPYLGKFSDEAVKLAWYMTTNKWATNRPKQGV